MIPTGTTIRAQLPASTISRECVMGLYISPRNAYLEHDGSVYSVDPYGTKLLEVPVPIKPLSFHSYVTSMSWDDSLFVNGDRKPFPAPEILPDYEAARCAMLTRITTVRDAFRKHGLVLFPRFIARAMGDRWRELLDLNAPLAALYFRNTDEIVRIVRNEHELALAILEGGILLGGSV